jgi:hypothetical protein
MELLLLSLIGALPGQTGEGPIWLVVTRPIFVDSLAPLAEKRRAEGFETVISARPVEESISELNRKPAFLLLVGDCQPENEHQPWYVPSPQRGLYRWSPRQRETFASDVLWGDFDSDLIPDIPVGRIPVRNAEQLKPIIQKILAFEGRPASLDDLRMPVWAGAPNYGPTADAMILRLGVALVRTRAPKWTRIWAILPDPSHPLCGWPPDQRRLFTEQLQRPSAFSVLIGHARVNSFYSMTFRGREIQFTSQTARNALANGNPGGPLAIFACYSGDFTRPRDTLSESLLSISGGPVAVIGATTVSHPLTNYFSSRSLLTQLSKNHDRLGDLWLAAQRQAMTLRDRIFEPLLRDVEGKQEEDIDVAKLRRDQMLMYALLGDPATQMRLPKPLSIVTQRLPDGGLYWKAQKPKGAEKLFVTFRTADQGLPAVGNKIDRDAAHVLFNRADATLDFEALDELHADQPWRGETSRHGALRLVAISADRIWAAVVSTSY